MIELMIKSTAVYAYTNANTVTNRRIPNNQTVRA